MRVRFGDFVFDAESHELRHDGAPVPLSPKAFRLLATLLAERPRALSKEELLEVLWPDAVVAEGSLTGLVSELRHALEETHHRSGLVRTVHAFGYAFSGEAHDEAPPPAARFWLAWGERELPLTDGENLLGREAIPDATVSRRHAVLVVENGCASLEDLGSKNGTFLGAARVTGRTALADGALVKLGSVVLSFHDRAAAGTTRTMREDA